MNSILITMCVAFAMLFSAVLSSAMVTYVATNDIRYASAQTISTGIQRIFADTNTKIDIDNTIEVANTSLSGPGFNQAEYDAIQGAVDSGVAFAVAAGNDEDSNI